MGLPEPFPVLVLLHDHNRSPFNHRGTAEFLARLGVAVLMPEMTLRVDRTSHVATATAVADHCRWLRTRASTPGDVLFERCDASKVALIGHGVGGAVALEAAIELQTHPDLPSLCGLLLMGVHKLPAAESVQRLQKPPVFLTVGVLSLREDQAAAAANRPLHIDGNGSGRTAASRRERNVSRVQRCLSFDSVAVLLRGATHNDFECQAAVARNPKLLHQVRQAH